MVQVRSISDNLEQNYSLELFGMTTPAPLSSHAGWIASICKNKTTFNIKIANNQTTIKLTKNASKIAARIACWCTQIHPGGDLSGSP